MRIFALLPKLSSVVPDSLEELRKAYNVTVLSEDPLILQFDNFLSAKECEMMIKLGRPHMERSTAGLERKVDNSRTSKTGWLMER